MLRLLCGLCFGLAACHAGDRVAQAFCLCFGPPPTLAGQLDSADAACLVRWISKSESPFVDDGRDYQMTTTYEVIETLKCGTPFLAPGTLITIDASSDGARGDLFVLFGTRIDEEEPGIDWSVSEKMSAEGWRYLKEAPRSNPFDDDSLPGDRLRYFVRFLEHDDETIAEDAFRECEAAAPDDLARLAGILPRANLRKWLAAEDTSPDRVGFYGLMLGFCGTPDDGRLLERIVLQQDDLEEFYGREGVMSGYLLLAGERGLAVLDREKLRNQQATFQETYAAVSAITFVRQTSPSRIELPRLQQSLRLLLDRQELAGTAIATLAEFEDWDAQDHVMRLYDACGYEEPAIKTEILAYLDASTRTKPWEQSAGHVVQAKHFLAEIANRDVETYRAVFGE